MTVAEQVDQQSQIEFQPNSGLAAELGHLPVRIGPSPWPGWEHVYGFTAYTMTFSSGHVLAVRRFPQNDFAPYTTVWHRTPEGDWSIFYDAPRPDIACPRYFGPAVQLIQPARIRLTWTGPTSFRVEMKDPALIWEVSMKTTPLLRAMNALNARLPLFTWRFSALVTMRAWMARWMFGMGNVSLSATMPSGHLGILMPLRVYFIEDSRAVFDGIDLGKPERVRANPTIGQVRLSARPAFAVGWGFWKIRDSEEYRRTVEDLRSTVGDSAEASGAGTEIGTG